MIRWIPSPSEALRTARVIIDLLTSGQRTALYWLSVLLRNTELDQEELIGKCAGQLCGGKYVWDFKNKNDDKILFQNNNWIGRFHSLLPPVLYSLSILLICTFYPAMHTNHRSRGKVDECTSLSS